MNECLVAQFFDLLYTLYKSKRYYEARRDVVRLCCSTCRMVTTRRSRRSDGAAVNSSIGRRREAVRLVCSTHDNTSTTTTTTSSTSCCREFQPSATTFTLLAVSFYLIATTLPVTVCYVLYPRFSEGDPAIPLSERPADAAWSSHYTYRDVKMMVEEFGMSHYACNFFIYLATGRSFRRELRRLVAKLVPCYRDLSDCDWSSQATSVVRTSRL